MSEQEKIERNFYKEYRELCKKYDLMLSPEDQCLLRLCSYLYNKEEFDNHEEEYFYLRYRLKEEMAELDNEEV